jgi:hypothetical protein
MHNFAYERYQGLVAMQLRDPGNAGSIDLCNHGEATCMIRTAAAETRTLLAPSRVGQRLTLAMDTDGGDAVVTVNSGVTGLATITLNDAGDTVTLEAITVGGVLKWQYLVNRGATIA